MTLVETRTPELEQPIDIATEMNSESVRLAAEQQAETLEITNVDLNENGERYAAVGGAVSNLPEHLWKLARTSAFKEWFGDWEHSPVGRFQTNHGSVYSYDRDGHTTRFKTATGEKNEKQDLTVFADLNIDEEQDFLASYRTEGGLMRDGKRLKLYVTEKLEDGTGKIVRTREDVGDPNRLVLAVLKDQQNGKFTAEDVVQMKRVSLQPAEGLNTFDTRQFKVDGVTHTERHLGNKVVNIDYLQSDVSKLMKKGEPQLLKDPDSKDESGYCFIRSVNPMKIDRATYERWSKQFGEGEGKRERIMEALQQQGNDGMFIDGQPAPFFRDEQMMRVNIKK